jgi:hypothetical protein
MKNIHILQIDKPSRLYSYKSIELFLHPTIVDANVSNLHCQNQNICITNDEEIKEGDAYITKHGEICKSHNGSKILLFKTDKKIILTTDQELISDGIEQISENVLLKIVEHVNSGKNIESFDEL